MTEQKFGSVKQKSTATVEGNTEEHDTEEDDRDHKRRGLSSVATSQSKSPRTEVLQYWDHLIGGELNERGV